MSRTFYLPLTIACPCGATHVTVLTTDLEPLIDCPDALPNVLTRVDTRYLLADGERVYRDYDGPLWIRGPWGTT
jgi:hypothetical protein